MTLAQYESLNGAIADFKVTNLANQENRTLLWGYDSPRNSSHTYLEDGVIHHVLYDHRDKLLFHTSSVEALFPLSTLIPDKRLYPEACDYEFTRILKERELSLPFTAFNYSRPTAAFYGKRLHELTNEESA
jgi:hypothetical protein